MVTYNPDLKLIYVLRTFCLAAESARSESNLHVMHQSQALAHGRRDLIETLTLLILHLLIDHKLV